MHFCEVCGEPGTDWAAGHTHTHIYTEYVRTQEPHFSITYYKPDTAHKIHVKNKMYKIMCYNCHRQVRPVCKPCPNVGSVTHATIITNNYLSCTQKIQLYWSAKHTVTA